MAEAFDPYYTWLAIPPEEQPADYYRLLGLRRFESNEEVIVNAADQKMAFVRTFQTGKRAKESQALLNELATAQACLLHPRRRLAYDEALRYKDFQPDQPSIAPIATAPPTSAQTPSEPLAGEFHDVATQPLPDDGPATWEIVTPDASAAAEEEADASLSNAGQTSRTIALVGGGLAAGGLAIALGLILWAANLPPPDAEGSLAMPGQRFPRPQPREPAENPAVVSPVCALADNSAAGRSAASREQHSPAGDAHAVERRLFSHQLPAKL